jgi:hypothetical protein
MRMIDALGKTRQLLAGLEAALPFDVDLSSSLLACLREQQPSASLGPRQTVSKISYAGDEGGIVCHISPQNGQGAIIVSITHVRMPASLPFAASVLDYQKHRIKKLKKDAGNGLFTGFTSKRAEL